jgi:hypothetical protein
MAVAMPTSQATGSHAERPPDRPPRSAAAPRARLTASAERVIVFGGERRWRHRAWGLVEVFLPLIGSVARIYRSKCTGRPRRAHAGRRRRALARAGALRSRARLAILNVRLVVGAPGDAAARLRAGPGDRDVRPGAAQDHARIQDAERTHLQRHGCEPSLSEVAEATDPPRAQVESLMAAERSPRALEDSVDGDHARASPAVASRCEELRQKCRSSSPSTAAPRVSTSATGVRRAGLSCQPTPGRCHSPSPARRFGLSRRTRCPCSRCTTRGSTRGLRHRRDGSSPPCRRR